MVYRMNTHDRDDVDRFLDQRGDVTLDAADRPSWTSTLNEYGRTVQSGTKAILTHPLVTVPTPFAAAIGAFMSAPFGPLVGMPVWATLVLSAFGFLALFTALPASYEALDEGDRGAHAILTIITAFFFAASAGAIGTTTSDAHFIAQHQSGLSDYHEAFESVDERPRSGAELIKSDALSEAYCPGVIDEAPTEGEGAASASESTTCEGPEGEATDLHLLQDGQGQHDVSVRYDQATERTILQIKNLNRGEASAIADEYDWDLQSYAPDENTAFFHPG